VTERQLKQYGTRPDQPETRAFAFALRRQLGDILHAAGGEHLQIGRYYPYEEELGDVHGEIMRAIKRAVDPDGLMAPGNLLTARGTDS
jgi:D-lactate dehydrogenase (cytochrome)